MTRFIDDFDVILLDMGNTFMFGCDRFGQSVDYFGTYAGLGGSLLGHSQLTLGINAVFARMLTDARDPRHFDAFGRVDEYIRLVPETSSLPPSEQVLLEEVFAHHEVGTIPKTHADALCGLRETHRLGLISNIWSHRGVFEAELRRVGVLDLFEVLVWSSDHRCIKPSPKLFHHAMDHFNVPAGEMVYIGDNPMRDVAGAQAVGMSAVWIENSQHPLDTAEYSPDRVISDLRDLFGANKEYE
jgi:putative hydrolase of the HAD superfamily